ncbi:MAG: HEAT repeat domain-containing protein, partial [Sediminibacterium sp.]
KANQISLLLLSWPRAWESYPLFIKICFSIALTALVGIVLAVADIYIWRKKKARQLLKKKELVQQISEILLSTIVVEAVPGKEGALYPTKMDTSPFYQLDLNDEDVRHILVCELISYRSYFSGAIALRIRRLYLQLGLDKDARKMLTSKNWETRVHGLSEMFKMDVASDPAQLLKLSNDKNKYISEFARLSLIKFTKGDPLDILRSITEPISQWEAFEIFFLFQQKEDYTLSTLEGLISLEKDPSIVSLCLQLVVHFKDLKSARLIIAILETPDLKLRAEAVAAIGKLQARGAEVYLMNLYPEQPHEIRLEIMTALGNLRNPQSLRFLEKTFLNSTDFEIKKNASDSIIRLYPLSRNTIDKLMNNTDGFDHRILSHSLNPLINAV